MDPYRYVDMFATKGAEYVLVIGFLLTLIFFWGLLHRPVRPDLHPRRVGTGSFNGSRWFQLPESTYYHQGHSWVVPEAKDTVRVGMDDFSQKLLGRCTRIILPRVGSKLRQGERAWQLQFHSKSIPMLSPVRGEVLAVNEKLVESPHLINRDPYGSGWLIKVRTSHVRENLTNLLTGKIAEAWLEESVNTLRGQMAGRLGTVLQDGGLVVEGFARNISPEGWDKVAEHFLLSGNKHKEGET